MHKEIDAKLLKDITEFFDAHPALFCFFADPVSDTIIAANDKRVIARAMAEGLDEVKLALNYKAGKAQRGQLTMKFASMIHSIARDRVMTLLSKLPISKTKGRALVSSPKK